MSDRIARRPQPLPGPPGASHSLTEGDYIVGTGNRSAIGTLVERTTRQLVLVHLGHDRSAVALREALTRVFGAIPAPLRRSLTWDQGKEMAGHLELTAAIGMPVYFCHAHSPWQRGSNENMNGLLRDYFPKHTDLRGHTAERLAAVAAEINARPRKTLGWARPADLFERRSMLVLAGPLD